MNNVSKYCEAMMQQLHLLGLDLKYVQTFSNEFIKYCKEHYPDELFLTKELAENWIYSYQTKSKQQMDKRVRTMKYLGRYLNSLGKDAYIPNYRIAPTPSEPPVIMTDEQLAVFFQACDSLTHINRCGHREYIAPVIFRLIYACGLRTSEICKLKLEDVDLQTGILCIYNSKGFKDRQIFMDDTIIALCRRYHKIYSQLLPNRTYFFQPTYKNSRYYNTNIGNLFDTILKKCGLCSQFTKKPSSHGLRHLFAIKSMKKCMDLDYNFDNWIKYLSKYMGHATPQETMYYLHMVPALLPEYSSKIKNFTEGIGVVYEEY